MSKSKNHGIAVIVLTEALEDFHRRGVSPVRASDLSRASETFGYLVPKKFVRRQLTENGDGVTPLAHVHLSESPPGRYWYALNVSAQTA